MLDETKPLDVILDAIQDISKEHEALQLANLIPLSEMDNLVKTGAIQHSLVVVAFYHYKLLKQH